MDWPALAAICVAITAGIAVVGFWVNLSDRISKADAAAAAAAAKATDAKKISLEALEKIGLLQAAFGLYREQVAREYIHREAMREMEDRLTQAIDRLGDRLDRFLEGQR